MSIKDIFKKKKRKTLYFAVVIADASLDKVKFENDKDCKLFVVNGEIEKHDVIPRSILKEMVERMVAPEVDGAKISEAKITEKPE